MPGLRKNFFYNAIISVSGILFPLITFPYVSRVLEPEKFGLVSFANSYIQYFIVLSTIGVPFYGIREIAKVKEDIVKRSKLFAEITVIHIGLTLGVLVVYIISIFYLEKCKSNIDFFLSGSLLLLSYPLSIHWFFTAIEDFKYVAIRTIILQVLLTVSVFIFVREKTDYFLYFGLSILGSIIIAYLNISHGLKYLKFDFLWKDLDFRMHIKPLLLIFLFTVATSLYELFDSVLLGFLSTNEAVSFFTVASRINKIPVSIIGVLSSVLLPRLSFAAAKGDKFEMARLIEKSINFVLLFGIPAIIGIFILSPEIVRILSGRLFESAILTSQIFSPTTLLLGLTTIFMLQILIPLSKDKELLIIVSMATIVSLILNFILIPIYKENGAAWASILTEIFVLIFSYIVAKKFIEIRFGVKKTFKNILLSFCFIIFAIIFRSISPSDLIVFISTFLSSSVLYFIVQTYIFKDEIFTEINLFAVDKIDNLFKQFFK